MKKNGSKTSSFGTTSRISHDSSQYYESRLYEGLNTTTAQEEKDGNFPKEYENRIILGSSTQMKELPDNCVHLMVTSPPYNVTKEYDANLTLKEYLLFLEEVFTEVYRVLTYGGRACINVANLGRKPYLPLSDYISNIMLKIGFLMRGEVIWYKAAGAGVSMAWGSWKYAANPVLRDTHEYILIFSKGSFSRKAKDRKNTITNKEFMEFTKSVWIMNPESAKKVNHPAPFPLELPYRLIQLYTFEDDIVLDPFIGSGTTAIAALKTGRRYVGYEVDPSYIQNAEKRIEPIARQMNLGI
jgi:site-specific DNA-methyltransferase (adenine-specific)